MASELEKKIGYEFRDPSLLATALVTPSCRMVNPELEDNQRLEFLGDAVFGLLSADAVYEAYPWEQEGQLTVRRTHLVSGAALIEAAGRIGLGGYLKRNIGAGPLDPKSKMLADAMEAVLGAVWLDGGIAAAKMVFDRLELPIGEKFNEWGDNPKGYLQVLSQARKPARLPKYTVVEEKGPSHSPTVTVKVEVPGMGSAVATANSRRRAETAAATALLEQLN